MTDYLTLHDIMAIHSVMMERYGGLHGVRDMGALESAVHRPQSGYYADIIEEAAALMESLGGNHPFADGNKRTAFAAVDVFLKINSYEITANADEIYQKMIGLFEEQKFQFAEIKKWLGAIAKPL